MASINKNASIGYSIFQLPTEHDNTFMNYEWAMNHGGVNCRDYETVYTGEIAGTDADMILEKLYTIFNTTPPADYCGRRLSVSDLVAVEGTGTYFCDSIGWKRIN